MRLLTAIIALVMVFNLTSCATIIHGGRQDIYVTSSPSGAVVRVDGQATSTPGSINLERKKALYVLVFEKEGYNPVEIELRRTVDGWLFGNILLGGIIGLVIDFCTGAAYKITPSKVNAEFRDKAASITKEGSDLIVYVDMEELEKYGVNVEDLERL